MCSASAPMQKKHQEVDEKKKCEKLTWLRSVCKTLRNRVYTAYKLVFFFIYRNIFNFQPLTLNIFLFRLTAKLLFR